jgi:hypothetical protein
MLLTMLAEKGEDVTFEYIRNLTDYPAADKQ